jgi:hypothetical protein
MRSFFRRLPSNRTACYQAASQRRIPRVSLPFSPPLAPAPVPPLAAHAQHEQHAAALDRLIAAAGARGRAGGRLVVLGPARGPDVHIAGERSPKGLAATCCAALPCLRLPRRGVQRCAAPLFARAAGDVPLRALLARLGTAGAGEGEEELLDDPAGELLGRAGPGAAGGAPGAAAGEGGEGGERLVRTASGSMRPLSELEAELRAGVAGVAGAWLGGCAAGAGRARLHTGRRQGPGRGMAADSRRPAQIPARWQLDETMLYSAQHLASLGAAAKC